MEDLWELAALIMTDNYDEIEISASGKGVAVKGKGKFVSRWGHGLADLFKPFGQFFGEKGDAIEHRRNLRKITRIYDEEVLKITLRGSLEKMESIGIEPRPIRTKFIVDWSDGASMEDQRDEENISDAYENLLVSEVKLSNPNNLIYLDFLRKLTKSHMLLLEKLNNGPLSPNSQNSHKYFDPNYVTNRLRKLVFKKFDLTKKVNLSNCLEEITKQFDFSGTAYTFIVAIDKNFTPKKDQKPKPNILVTRSNTDLNSEQGLIQALEHIGLVRAHSIAIKRNTMPIDIFCNYVALTDLGSQFIKSCLLKDRSTQL